MLKSETGDLVTGLANQPVRHTILDVVSDVSSGEQVTENEQLIQAAIRSGKATLCAAENGDFVYQFTGTGIADLLQVAELKLAANHGAMDWGDKLVGRAAALLFTLLHPKSVFARTMSAGAQDILQAAAIPFIFDEVVVEIRNRTNTGPCPMEAATACLTDPLIALQVLHNMHQKLSETGAANVSGKEIL